MKITKYEDAFNYIGVKINNNIKTLLHKLESEGRKEKNICYAIWKSADKLISFKDYSRFYSVLENEIRKLVWVSGDKRWNNK